jgi:hypothetical protein
MSNTTTIDAPVQKSLKRQKEIPRKIPVNNALTSEQSRIIKLLGKKTEELKKQSFYLKYPVEFLP